MDIGDLEIADGVKEGWERDRARVNQLEEVEDRLLPEHHTESERMLLRAWLLDNEVAHIQYHNDGTVADVMGIETVDDEPTPEFGERVDRFDLRECDSPDDVLSLIQV